MSKSERLELRTDEAGQRIDLFLASRTQLSRSAIQRLARDGRVTANGLPVEPSYKIHAGEDVVVDVPDAQPALSLLGEDIPIDVLYEDEDVLVVNKPAGLVVHPAHGHATGTLVNAVVGKITADTGRDAARPGIVHRLDKDTSGVMIVAKNDVAHLALSRQIPAISRSSWRRRSPATRSTGGAWSSAPAGATRPPGSRASRRTGAAMIGVRCCTSGR